MPSLEACETLPRQARRWLADTEALADLEAIPMADANGTGHYGSPLHLKRPHSFQISGIVDGWRRELVY
ncbi:hypothetical protein VTJ49DRAFT_2074 [Mycothermus thermophilus]|uniref:Uncharacterized protein n=1 Tax=Humicola insolens TaxID=85995 RepID=A0ABR3VAU3_HUMIN